MTNGVTQGVAQHFVKYHTDLNVRIRDLKVLPGTDKSSTIGRNDLAKVQKD